MAEASNDDPGSNHNLNEKIVREAIERQISLGRLDIAMAIEERFQSCDKSSTDGIMIDQVDLDTQADEEAIVAKSTFDGIVQYLHKQEEKGQMLPEKINIFLNSVKVSLIIGVSSNVSTKS